MHNKCALISYRDLCERALLLCNVKTAPVSRLSHSFDWSVIRTSRCKDGNILELTSLSAHVSDLPVSISLTIARVADVLIRSGFGSFCDVVVVIAINVEHALMSLISGLQAISSITFLLS